MLEEVVTYSDIDVIIKLAQEKYLAPMSNKGFINVAEDERNFYVEAEEELLDAINYCVAAIKRIRRLNA